GVFYWLARRFVAGGSPLLVTRGALLHTDEGQGRRHFRAQDWHSMSDASALTKLFVLDTNVILHDAGCLRNFAEHDVALPITVLEELDHFKRGNEDINFQARQFLRNLDE